MRAIPCLAAVTVATVMFTACGDGDGDTAGGNASTAVIDPGDGGDYDPDIEPADFVETIDNPWFPLEPGRRWVYEGEEDGEVERVEVTVTDDRREVMGISAVVVRDTVTVDGELVEDTFDWFAQDRDGNVWYLGEESTEFEDGEPVSTEGSWEAGVDGAVPGVVMWADPRPGQAYRQEFFQGEAEDLAEVKGFGGPVTVPAGSYEEVLVIREWNPLEPDVVEEKSYAEGIGLVLEKKVEGGEARIELLEVS